MSTWLFLVVARFEHPRKGCTCWFVDISHAQVLVSLSPSMQTHENERARNCMSKLRSTEYALVLLWPQRQILLVCM